MLLASVVLTLLLYFIPAGRWLAYPLMLLSTLAHELGHGVAALLVGGSFHRFQMWPDGSGVAVWGGNPGRLGRAWVAAGGLLGPAVVAAVAFASSRTARGARACLMAFGVVLTLALLLVVRNLFGALFVALLVLALVALARKARADAAQLALVFLAVQLALSVFSRGDYLFTPVAETAQGLMPSDVGQMAEALLLPYWFWGFLCAVASVLVLALGLRGFWR